MLRPILILLAMLLATPLVAAERTFDIRLAGATLGRVFVSGDGATTRLESVMNNTPMGVGDGRFDASFANGAYRSLGQSPGERRRIDIDFSAGRVARVDIDPASEATDASAPGTVPAGVFDPARGFARLALASDCVDAFRLYDGRRVVQVSPSSREEAEGAIVCRYAYRVTQGPGHLSPFRFRNVTVVAAYVGGTVRDIALGAGPFTVRLVQR